MNELLIDRLRTARNECGLKQQDVAKQMGIKANTISNWEKGRTEPDIDSFVKLCEIYRIDCATLLSDVYAFKRIHNDISLSEYDNIKKYRTLDPHGKDMVDTVLDKEYTRCESIKKAEVIQLADRSYLDPEAAHDRTDIDVTPDLVKKDDDIMDNDDEWK